MARIRSYGPAAVLVVVMATVLVGGPSIVRQLAWAEQDARLEHSRQALADNPLAQLSESFREVARTVEPSVVHISVSRHEDRRRMVAPEDLEGLRRWFFEERGRPRDRDRDGDGERPEGRDGADRYREYDVPEQYGSGSGWVYQHANGNKYVITNNHVIQEADQITVRFNDHTTRRARVVGEPDTQTDIAVLRVENNYLHAAELAAEAVEQGEIVFAFGSPFGFEFSMSQGIVSGKGRRLGIIGRRAPVGGYENFIQTDAAINRGNSGGPLTNIRGEVVGMNTAIATQTGINTGLGFAIPIDMIRDVIDQIIEDGAVTRGFLGVWIRDLEPEAAETYAFDSQGVLVDDVGPDSPAERGGLRYDDIITEIEGEPVRDAAELRMRIAAMRPGEVAALTLFRDGELMTLEVELGEQPSTATAMSRPSPREAGAAEEQVSPDDLEPLRRLGFERVSTMTPELADRAGIEFTPGVLVRDLRPGSVAQAEGLRGGAVITEVGGTPVESVSDLLRHVADMDRGDTVRLRIRAGDRSHTVFLRLP